MIISPWLTVVVYITEYLATGRLPISKDIASEGKSLLQRHEERGSKQLGPAPLVELRMHLHELRKATDALIPETHSGVLSASYKELRSQWVTLYAPAHTVLHNLDPRTISKVGIYSPELAGLLEHNIVVSKQTLREALEAEQKELAYDDHAHICTLCLHIVSEWSESKTILGGLQELSNALTATVSTLDHFIKSSWSAKEVI